MSNQIETLHDSSSTVLDVIRAQLVTECRHGAVAVGDLGDDGAHIVLAVGDQGILLQLLLSHDAVVATRMAGCAVALEHRLAVLQVRRQGRPGGGHCCQQSQGSADGERAPRSSGLLSGGSTWLLRNRAGTLLRRATWRAGRQDEAAGAVERQGNSAHHAGDAGHGRRKGLGNIGNRKTRPPSALAQWRHARSLLKLVSNALTAD